MSEDIDKKIDSLTKMAKKKVDKTKKEVKKNLKELDENFVKFRNALHELKGYEEKIIEEGVEKYQRKGKLWFKSLNALTEFAKFAYKQTDEFEPPDYNTVDFTYDELKTFVRQLSNIVNNIDKELRRANSIMGLDFALKKRSATTPFHKITSVRNRLRDSLQDDYKLIKVFEDLEKVKNEIEELNISIGEMESNLHEITSKIKENSENLENMVQMIKKLENEDIYAVIREKKIEGEKCRIEIGTKINPLKKSFRLLVNKANEVDANFAAVSAGQMYEKNVIDAFNKDAPDFKQLRLLLETLIKKEKKLKLKKSIVQKSKALISSIDNSKLANLQSDLTKINEKITELEKNPEIMRISEEIEDLRKKIEIVEKEKVKNKAQEEIIKNKLEEGKESMIERTGRIEELLKEGEKMIEKK
ncbi:MAG: hypothetical protein ACTSP4_09720 [Candidatus Hodarchaeales archaeon]